MYNRLNALVNARNGYVVANNISKIGYAATKNDKGETERIAGRDISINRELSFLLKEEISICKPNLLLFFCSYSRDQELKDCLGPFFPEPCISGVNVNQFAKLTFQNETLPIAYRTYHPNYLHYKNKQEWSKLILKFLEQLLSQSDTYNSK